MAKRGRPRKIVEKQGNVGYPDENSGEKFEVILNVGGKDHIIKTNNVIESLQQFEPLKLGGKCLLTVKRGGKQIEQLFYPQKLKRLFVNKVARELFQKRCEQWLR